jgi:predicted MFS family arabinose efflux permease
MPNAMLAPLRYPVFRRMWAASLLSNFGQLIQGVGAAWAMTELTRAADMVALVQTAAMLPLMIFALSAGAIADTYDRRKVALVALSIAFCGAIGLTLCTWLGLLAPPLILIFTFIIGSGMSLFGPSWLAISLNSISYNIARSFGPAIGGLIVAAGGTTVAFLMNALFFLPMIAVLLLWRRVHTPSRLPPERLRRAIVSGVRYVYHSPPIRITILRSILTTLLGCALPALMPIIARELLHGGAQIYGLVLGAFGIGAVFGALNVAVLTRRFGPEFTVRGCSVFMAAAMIVVALSSSVWLSSAALLIAGSCWMIAVTIFNIGVQTMAPRWVAGRALAAFQASIAGGIAIGSWIWGHVAKGYGVDMALIVAGSVTLLSVFAGRWLRVHEPDTADEAVKLLADPEVKLALNGRSGPIAVEIEYRVARHRARAFYGTMQEVQLSRQRNGAYQWSIARDISDPELWTERYHCPTWLDYLRQRNRPTQAERELHGRAFEFHSGPEPLRVRRMLERPFGSVRWSEDVQDSEVPTVLPVPPNAGGH